jgi:hypothetical protein
VQLRLATALTFEAYVTGEQWATARLSSCPVCGGPVTSHGTYTRKRPQVAQVARFYCAPCRMTIGVLPDFYASRMPGLLDEIEEVVATAELARSVEAAAEEVRPADEADAVTLTAAVRWLRRRVAPIHRLLATAIGLVPGRFEGCAPTVRSFRERLGTTRALVALREICAGYLHAMAEPLGLLGPPERGVVALRRRQQSMGPGPPAPIS